MQTLGNIQPLRPLLCAGGWANFGIHNNDKSVVTPNMDALVAQGVELDRH